jgi:hypothetical protein
MSNSEREQRNVEHEPDASTDRRRLPDGCSRPLTTLDARIVVLARCDSGASAESDQRASRQ